MKDNEMSIYEQYKREVILAIKAGSFEAILSVIYELDDRIRYLEAKVYGEMQ